MSDCAFHGPLSRKTGWSYAKRFRYEVNEGVNALSNEMNAFGLLAIVKIFKFQDPLEKGLLGESELVGGNFVLVHSSDSEDQLTVVFVVRLRK